MATAVPDAQDLDLDRTVQHIVGAIGAAAARDDPFPHLQFASIFPPDIYAAMLDAMPAKNAYRRMSGRTRSDTMSEGVPTRTKIDLFPEYIRHLPDADQPIWDVVGRALCSAPVREAFRKRLAPGLSRRFGDLHRTVGMYPIPVLTRDVPGYRIGIHPDTRHKAMTIQIYLPRDRSIEHVGTVFHRRTGPKSYERSLQMPFAPNSGYAFAVASDTYHSVDPVGPEVATRDSILLTYFVDGTWIEVVHNRAKRFGNLVLNEARSLLR